jgi:hypothetical protein
MGKSFRSVVASYDGFKVRLSQVEKACIRRDRASRGDLRYRMTLKSSAVSCVPLHGHGKGSKARQWAAQLCADQ